MRCNPSKWLLGIIPIAFLSWLAVQVEREGIEADLGRRTQEALSRKGIDWASPIFLGRDGRLAGQASDERDPPRAMAAIRDIWGVRLAHDETGLLDKVEKFFWSVTSTPDKRVVISGYVPSPEARQTVMATAEREFGRRKIFDDMKLARGAPKVETWTGAATFVLHQVAQLKNGTGELAELDLSVDGVAGTVESYRNVRTALKEELPRGVALKSERIIPPTIDPYLWTVKWNGSEVTLSGFVPTEEARSGIRAQIKRAFPKAQITDKADYGTGAPEAWDRAVGVALTQLAALKAGFADIKGRDFTFSGTAANEERANAVRRAVKGEVPQNYKVRESIRYLKPDSSVSGYTMAIANEGDKVVVSGQVPSEAARTALVDAVRARFPGTRVTDTLKVLPGAPDGWQQCIIAGLAPLPRLATGKTVLVDNRLTVTGKTADYGVSKSVPQEVVQAAGQACEATTEIAFTGELKNNLVWKAVRDERGTVLLEGDVPDDPSRGRLLDTAQRLFKNARVTDKMRIRPAPEQPWLDVALNSLYQLALLQSGEVAMSGGDIVLKGLASSEEAASEARDNFSRDLPSGFKARAAIDVMSEQQREASTCQEMMRDASARGVIEFSRASADLIGDSAQTLNELAEIANECPSARIEIEGHTDAEGTDERNQRLSDRRANSVANYLAGRGVARTRMSTVGYGASQPIADNNTDEGRARNRRIEFFVKPN